MVVGTNTMLELTGRKKWLRERKRRPYLRVESRCEELACLPHLEGKTSGEARVSPQDLLGVSVSWRQTFGLSAPRVRRVNTREGEEARSAKGMDNIKGTNGEYRV